jgi:gamma-glutamylcyclotransferase (GGCT)/AIG2-like uncharacterized protein YtfP
MLYFAYGSNMDDAQMRHRCPDARRVGIAVLAGHRLCFPRRSQIRGCGVASVEPREGHEVWGVVYDLGPEDIASLDRREGYDPARDAAANNYNRVAVLVAIDGVATEVLTYLAVPQASPPPPSVAYLAHLRSGARHHGLPEAYVASLDRIEGEA